MRLAVWAALAVLLCGLATAVPARAAGSWVGHVQAPVLRQRDWPYRSAALTAASVAPDNSRLTRVSWRHHYQPWLPELRIRLCARQTCVSANRERGWSDAFRGWPADTVFHFVVRVAGAGLLRRPMHSSVLQLIVNYD